MGDRHGRHSGALKSGDSLIKNVADLPPAIDRLYGLTFKGLKAATSGGTPDGHLGPLPPNLNFEAAGITDAGLRAIGYRFRSMTYLALHHTSITGEGFDAFRGKAMGSKLYISYCPLTAEGLERFGETGKIISLSAGASGIKDAGLAAIGKHTEMSGDLSLPGNPITDAGLTPGRHRSRCRQLTFGIPRSPPRGSPSCNRRCPSAKSPGTAVQQPRLQPLHRRRPKSSNSPTSKPSASWPVDLECRRAVDAVAGGTEHPDATEAQLAACYFKLIAVHYDRGAAIDDQALERMVHWPLPPQIGLNHAGITDAGLRQLASLKHPSLRLSLSYAKITGMGFDALAGRTLGNLNVSSCPMAGRQRSALGSSS